MISSSIIFFGTTNYLRVLGIISRTWNYNDIVLYPRLMRLWKNVKFSVQLIFSLEIFKTYPDLKETFDVLFFPLWENMGKVCLINSNTILQNARRITQPSAKQLKHAIGLSHSQLALFPFLSSSISPRILLYGINTHISVTIFIGK